MRRRGWAQSIGEREPGVGSVSAPVRGPNGRVVAALSVSGPIERITTPHIPLPSADSLEDLVMPSADGVASTVEKALQS